MSSMFNIDVFLGDLSEAEVLKDHPVIQAAAGSLAVQFSNVIIDNEEVSRIADTLADFKDFMSTSHEVIQGALIAAEPRLGEIWEEYYHTY